jgi:transposase
LEFIMPKIPRRRFTDDFRTQAVSLAQSIGPSAAARKLGISVKTLANWVSGRVSAAPATSKRRPITDLEAELSRLQSENATLKMEREILKKAAAFFAKESK